MCEGVTHWLEGAPLCAPASVNSFENLGYNDNNLITPFRRYTGSVCVIGLVERGRNPRCVYPSQFWLALRS